MTEYVWIFHGAGARFASGVFRELEDAERWIRENGFSGLLTSYPMDSGVYDWAASHNLANRKQSPTTELRQNFTTASMEHHHYENGFREV